MNCHHCGFEVELKEKIKRQEICPKCGEYLHCCLNCRFYDEMAYHQCRETQVEWVQDKKGANFCDYFEPKHSSDFPDQKKKSDDARKKLDELFGEMTSD
jgi:hypothetical protein